jgi:murein DD-endopeptidase MepM/ murein hydrolase activator NlpD
LLWSRKHTPKRIRVFLLPDSGQEAMEFNLPLLFFRLLAAFIVVGVLALLFLIFSSGSLMLERQQRRILERRLDDMTLRLARVHSLEAQLEESNRYLLRIQAMLGIGGMLPDSLTPQTPLEPEQTIWASRGGGESPQSRQMLAAIPSAWPVRGWVARSFNGQRGPDHHPGMDITAAEGTPIRAAGDGIVLAAGWNDEYGYYVLLDHGFSVTSLYAHNSSLAVNKEDRVQAGDLIAFLGNTGQSTGPHLHFEIRRSGIPVDPKNYLLD